MYMKFQDRKKERERKKKRMKSDQIVKFTFLALDEAMSTHVSAAFIQNTPTVRATLRV